MIEKKRKSGLPRLIQIAGSKRWWLIASMILAVLSAVLQFIPFVSVYEIVKELAANAAEPAVVLQLFFGCLLQTTVDGRTPARAGSRSA